MSVCSRPLTNTIFTSVPRNLSKLKMPKMNFKIEKRDLQLWVFSSNFFTKIKCIYLFNIAPDYKNPWTLAYFTRTFHRSCSIKSLNSKGQWVDLFCMTEHPCQMGHHSSHGLAGFWSWPGSSRGTSDSLCVGVYRGRGQRKCFDLTGTLLYAE